MDSWQDISTAPRDGTAVLLYEENPRNSGRGKGEIVLAEYEGGGWYEYTGGVECVRVGVAGPLTHWMPLPAPPGR